MIRYICFLLFYRFKVFNVKILSRCGLFCLLCVKEVESPEIKDEIESEDVKPADSSAISLSSKKEPLVQATLSSMFIRAEEKKARVQNHLPLSITNRQPACL
jgi:hypothetical protein